MDVFIAKITWIQENKQCGCDIIKREYKGKLSDCHSFLSRERKNVPMLEESKQSIKKLTNKVL